MRDLLCSSFLYFCVLSPSTGTIVFPKMDEIQVEVDAKTFQILQYSVYFHSLTQIGDVFSYFFCCFARRASLSKKVFPNIYCRKKEASKKKKEEKHWPQCLVAASNVRLIAGKEKM